MPFDRRLMPAVAIGLLNVFSIGFGMGVPVFAIAIGFAVGWWLVRGKRGPRIGSAPMAPDATGAASTTAQPVAMYAVAEDPPPVRSAARSLLAQASALGIVTFAAMVVIWGQYVPAAFDSAVDTAGAGIPLILYGQQASMIGWLVLMIVLAPALQVMAVLTGGVLALSVRPLTALEQRRP